MQEPMGISPLMSIWLSMCHICFTAATLECVMCCIHFATASQIFQAAKEDAVATTGVTGERCLRSLGAIRFPKTSSRRRRKLSRLSETQEEDPEDSIPESAAERDSQQLEGRPFEEQPLPSMGGRGDAAQPAEANEGEQLDEQPDASYQAMVEHLNSIFDPDDWEVSSYCSLAF